MIESVLTRKNASLKFKITLKSLIAVTIIALAVVLPQFVHLVAGQNSGAQWLPMYLPILLGSCLLGTQWGLSIGIAAPVASFIITSAISSPMPALARLPFMIVELAVFASVSGAFSKKIAENSLYAFPAVILAQLSGRTVFMLSVLIFQTLTPFTPAVVWEQICMGFSGLAVQAVIVPLIVIGLCARLKGEEKNG